MHFSVKASLGPADPDRSGHCGVRVSAPVGAGAPREHQERRNLARQSDDSEKSSEDGERRGIQSAPLKPIRVVRRELTRPDGTKVSVEVPVYPAFRLEERPLPKPPERARRKPRAPTKRSEPKD